MPWKEGVYRRPTNEEFEELGAHKIPYEDFLQLKEAFINKVDSMSIVELDRLVKGIQGHFGVSYPVEQVIREITPEKEEEEVFVNVLLTGVGESRVAIVKELRNITSLSLRECNEATKNLPAIVKENIYQKDAKVIIDALEARGASIITEIVS